MKNERTHPIKTKKKYEEKENDKVKQMHKNNDKLEQKNKEATGNF